MDNVTHTLIGVAIGRSAERRVGDRRLALWAGMLGSNLPDFDVVVPPLLARLGEDSRLAYLLHHRGHTHTLALAPALSLLGAALALRFAGRRPREFTRGEFGRTWLLTLLACLLHVGADWWNNYGVHPFWPLSGRWFHGDFVFIIEPLLWFAALPLALAVVRNRLARGLWFGLGAIMLALLGFGPFTPPAVTVFAVLWLVAFAFAQRRLGTSPAATWVGISLVLAATGAGSRLARARVEAELVTHRPIEARREIIVTPAPANPWCWSALALTVDAEGIYRARHAAVSLAPAFFADDRACRQPLDHAGTAPLAPSGLPDARGLRWGGEFRAPVAELRALRDADCRAASALRFLRAPFWVVRGGRLTLGDLRYDRVEGEDFPELTWAGPPAAPADCPRFVPAWETAFPLL